MERIAPQLKARLIEPPPPPRASKYCPLLYAAYLMCQNLSADDAKCLGEECALWSELYGECLVKLALIAVTRGQADLWHPLPLPVPRQEEGSGE